MCIEHMNDLSTQHSSARYRSTVQFNWDISGGDILLWTEAIASNVTIGRSLQTGNGGHLGCTQLRGRFNKRVEHRLQIERRATDNLEHVCGRCLLL